MKKNKIGIISDTHNLLRTQVIDILKTCDYVLHAGDFSSKNMLHQLESTGNLIAVRGNNDQKKWSAHLKEELWFEIGAYRFYMIHDITYAHAPLDDVDFIIHGHTHEYDLMEEHNSVWLNPGSCGPSFFNDPVTMAVLYIKGKHYNIEKINITE